MQLRNDFAQICWFMLVDLMLIDIFDTQLHSIRRPDHEIFFQRRWNVKRTKQRLYDTLVRIWSHTIQLFVTGSSINPAMKLLWQFEVSTRRTCFWQVKVNDVGFVSLGGLGALAADLDLSGHRHLVVINLQTQASLFVRFDIKHTHTYTYTSILLLKIVGSHWCWKDCLWLVCHPEWRQPCTCPLFWVRMTPGL